MNLTEKKKLKLLQIEKARNMLSFELNVGFITEEEIINLLRKKTNYGFKHKDRKNSYKESVLKSIFNAPFILCDQESLSVSLKKLLPIFLNNRYSMEIEELKYLLNNGYISKDEYIEEEKIITYCYYGSSNDGKSILKTGHVDNVLDNKIRVK